MDRGRGRSLVHPARFLAQAQRAAFDHARAGRRRDRRVRRLFYDHVGPADHSELEAGHAKDIRDRLRALLRPEPRYDARALFACDSLAAPLVRIVADLEHGDRRRSQSSAARGGNPAAAAQTQPVASDGLSADAVGSPIDNLNWFIDFGTESRPILLPLWVILT